MAGQISKLSIRDLELEGKRVLIRVDFNVPLESGKVVEDTRIQAALPTLRLALDKGGRVILVSHLGRPKGEPRPEFSLRPVAGHLAGVLGQEVAFAADCVGPEVEEAAAGLEPGEVLLLENVRFHTGETRNDPEFASRLARLADEYVNDAFGTAHRAHASTVGVPRVLGRGAAGLLMERELNYLSRVLYAPEKPVVAILGGAKVSDKIEVIENFLGFVSGLLLGGGMAFTFLKAQGAEIGDSILEEDKLELAGRILAEAASRQISLLLPTDVVVAPRKDAPEQVRTVPARQIPSGWMGLDIGPETVRQFRRQIAEARTIIWNGPLGVFEIDAFSRGTVEIARAVADSPALSVVGGGDSVAAVKRAGVEDRITHISTGGGASLEFLAGKELPGVAVLSEARP